MSANDHRPARRSKSTIASRKSRAKTTAIQADPSFVFESPLLTAAEVAACRTFLDAKVESVEARDGYVTYAVVDPVPVLSARSRDLLIRHLQASQTQHAHRCRTLIQRLEAMSPGG